ncbi:MULTISPECIES: sensor histidine kinase [Niastella]|uniref:histidine kinase n=1 Tax=Niastella soli TaxID=2821487 RepID=A0ABS3YRM7_9BACT|nr:ATP-binding protein [Niastella soli]MBO9200523.1 PAS domain-containing protein [Niastella soli]
MVSKINQYEINLADKLNDASIDRLMAINNEWEIINWNKTSEIISGIKKEEALGKRLVELFPQLQEDTEMMHAYTLAFQGKKSFLPARPEMFNRNYYENHFIPLFDDDNNIIGVMNIMHDVSHRIKAERKLEQLHHALKERYQLLEKANAEMATFTAITGNDLKEPIKRVYTTLEMIMIQDGARLSNSSKAGLRRIQASLNRIKLLLDDILSLSSISSFNTTHTQVNVQELMKQVVGALDKKIQEKSAVIRFGNLPTVTGSQEMLYSLFYNLVDNALKFQPAGNIPVIEIVNTIVTERKKDVNGHFEEQYYCISIADNGIGFNQEDAEKMFNIFVRLHSREEFRGSGTGLTLCQKIANAHGGYITAEGTPDKGSTFRCYLPLEQHGE